MQYKSQVVDFILYKNGEDGNTPYIHIKYSDDGGTTFTANAGETPGNYLGVYADFTETDSLDMTRYKWSKIKGEQGIQGLQGIQGPRGEQGIQGEKGNTGETTYFHIKYSSVENPTSSSQMTETPSTYIGTYVDFTKTDSTDPSKYKWSRFQGMQGEQGIQGVNGIDGKSSYLHIKYSNDGGKTLTSNNGETPGDYIGTYVDEIQNDSTEVSKYTWVKIKGEQGIQGLQGIQGPQGEQGIPGVDAAQIVFEYAVSNSLTIPPTAQLPGEGQIIPSTGNKLGTPVIYLTDGTWYSVMPERVEGMYIWQRITQIYPDGTTEVGEPICLTGDRGDTGKTTYFHIKYSSVANPTSSSQMTETPSKYIGTYVDYTQNDSTDPSKYKWSQFIGDDGQVGPQGEQGIPGTNGQNGKTSYLHIKYSNDGGKTFTSNNGETVGDYIGQCVDFNENDPSSISSYKWSKIKGEQGIQGIQGPQGLQGIQGEKGEQGTGVTIKGSYATESELKSAHPTGTLGDAYLVSGDLYVWSGTAWENVGNIQGPQGETGTGVASITAQYYVSTSKTEQTGGEWQENMPTWEVNTYLWIRYKIVYKDPESTVYTEPYCESSWEAANQMGEELREVISETHTEIIKDCEQIILGAMESYTEISAFETYKKVMENQLKVLSDQTTLQFTQTTSRLTEINNSLQEQINTITKYFTFDINGLTIGQKDNPYKVIVDNDRYSMTVNDVEVMWIADGKVYTPEMEITRAFKLFGYLIDRDQNGNVNCAYIGGE